MGTKLAYLEDMQLLELEALVVAVDRGEVGRTVVLLDQTVFYPQGGGQPFDTGAIASQERKRMFAVQEVRFVDGIVRHIGVFAGEPFSVAEAVVCQVDGARRLLHSRLHSAGHVLDMALKRLGMAWIPCKGYHFSDGPYVEYAGSFGESVDELKSRLEVECNTIITDHIPVEVKFMPREEMLSVCAFVPEKLPESKPGRVVMYGSFGIPCGGTHVKNLADIGRMQIRKIRQSGSTIRVSYALA